MPKTKKPANSSAAVGRYRERMAETGAETVYAMVSADAASALQTIIAKRACTKREALEYALSRASRELTRAR
jgi:hypothetical protein